MLQCMEAVGVESKKGGTSVAHILSSTQIARNGTHVSHIADLSRFMVANAKAFRGTEEVTGSDSCGFFLALLERDLAKNSTLRHIAESIPKHCTYTSHD